MLAALHEVPVQAGDAVLVPAGTLHAIGGGILLLELQEPTDLSVLVEWKKFGVDDGTEHLELGWETALESLDREPIDPAALTERDRRGMLPEGGRRLLPRRADRARGDTLDQSFSIVLVTGGEGTIGERWPVRARQHRAGPVRRRRRHRRRASRASAASRPTRPRRRPGEPGTAARSAQDRQVVRPRARRSPARTSRSTPQEVVALVGDNGAGKSTLVKTLVGVHPPDSGEILFEGEPVAIHTPQQARAIGIETVYQDLALAAEIDPAANMFLGREILRGGPLGKLGFLDKADDAPRAATRRSATSACRSRTPARPSPTCPAASARASRSAARSRGRARSCSWTSRPPRSASSRPATCSTRSSACATRASPSCSSATTCRRSSRSPTASRCCGSASASPGCAPSDVSMEDVVSAMTGALTFHEEDER